MPKKYFRGVPNWVAGTIAVFASMLDGLAISQVIGQETVIAVILIALRSGAYKFIKLYEADSLIEK